MPTKFRKVNTWAEVISLTDVYKTRSAQVRLVMCLVSSREATDRSALLVSSS